MTTKICITNTNPKTGKITSTKNFSSLDEKTQYIHNETQYCSEFLQQYRISSLKDLMDKKFSLYECRERYLKSTEVDDTKDLA